MWWIRKSVGGLVASAAPTDNRLFMWLYDSRDQYQKMRGWTWICAALLKYKDMNKLLVIDKDNFVREFAYYSMLDLSKVYIFSSLSPCQCQCVQKIQFTLSTTSNLKAQITCEWAQHAHVDICIIYPFNISKPPDVSAEEAPQTEKKKNNVTLWQIPSISSESVLCLHFLSGSVFYQETASTICHPLEGDKHILNVC